MKNFIVFFAFFFCMNVAFSQENDKINKLKLSSDLKTYEGNFQLGFGFFIYENFDGKAIYQYEEAPDGSRIFEGKFSFKSNNGLYIAEGLFRNNKQIGKWVWKTAPEVKNSVYCELCFNETGKLNGRFKAYAANCYYMGSFSYGVLTELKVKDYSYNKYYTSEGRYGKNKRPIGEWKIKEDVQDDYTITTTYDANGYREKSGYRDITTGDWIDYSVSDSKLGSPERMYKEVTRIIEYWLLLRSTRL